MKTTNGWWMAALIGLLTAQGGLLGSTRTWDGGGANAQWDTPANWDGDASAPAGGDALAFGGSAKLNNTNTLSADTSFAGIAFNSGAGAFLLHGARLVLGGDVVSSAANLQTIRLAMILDATRTFNTAGSGSITAAGEISGSGGVIKTGAQTLTLSGTNTYTGATVLQQGTLRVNSLNRVVNGAPGSSLGAPVTVADGTIAIGSGTNSATLYRTGLSNEVTDRVIDLAGTTGGATLDNSGANNTIKFTSDFTASGSGDKKLTLYSFSGAGEVAGSIVDSAGGATTVECGGTTPWILSGLSTYTGPTIINNNGGLKVNSIRNLGEPSAMGAPVTVENGTIKLGVGANTKTLLYIGSGSNTTDRVLDLSGTTGGATLDMSGSSGFLRFTTNLTASGAGEKTFTVTSASGTWTNEFNGVIPNSAGGATRLSLVNFGGPGSVILSGLNTYTGSTTIGAFSGSVIINSIKNVNGGASSLGNPASGAAVIAMGSGAFGAGLTYVGPGDTTDRPIDMKGTTGGATLNQSGDGLLKFTSDLIVSGAGSKTLTLAGSSAGTGEVAGAIADNSMANKTSLAKNGTGTWIVSGSNTYSGSMTVNGGTLILSGYNSYSGTTTIAGGALVLAGHSLATNMVYVGTGGRLELYHTNIFLARRLVYNAGAATNLKATLSLRADGDATFARDIFPNGSSFDAIYEFNVDRATPGGPLDGTITWGSTGTNMVFNNDRGQLLVTGDNGYGLTLKPNLSWAGQNQTQIPNIVNLAPGLLTLQGNLTGQNVNDRAFEFTGTGGILVNGNISGGGYHIRKSGTNTLTLAGTNTWVNNGGFVVDGGTLRLAPTAAFYPAGRINVVSGTLDMNSVTGASTTITLGGGAAGTKALLDTGSAVHSLSNTVTYNGHVAHDDGASIQGRLALPVTRTFAVNNSAAAAADLTVSASISGPGGLAKSGLGTLVLAGSNSFAGATTINAGTLVLDYTDNTNNKINPATALTIGASGYPATFRVVGLTGDTVAVASVTLTGSSNSLAFDGAGAVSLGRITRAIGNGPLALSATGGGTLRTETGTPNAILTNLYGIVIGTFNSPGDWAARASDGVTITSLSAIGGYTAMGTFASGANADITGDLTPPSGSIFNSIRFNTPGAATLTLSGANRVTTGGILVTTNVGPNTIRFAGTGTLSQPTGNNNGELVVIQHNTQGDLEFETPVVNTSGRMSLTKSGAGRLILLKSNPATGNITLNEGVLQFGETNSVGTNEMFASGYSGFKASAGAEIRIRGAAGFTVNNLAAISPSGGPVTIDVGAGCLLLNAGLNDGGGTWVKTGPGTLRQTGAGYIYGWVKEGTFLSDAGANYTINGGCMIGATNVGALPALVKILGSREGVLGGSATINRSGILDINGRTQLVGTVTFVGGGLVTNSGVPVLLKNQVFNYNVVPGAGETARWLPDLQGSWNRNDSVAMAFTINDDPTLDVEAVVAGSISGYPGFPGWAISKSGAGTLFLTGTNAWTGTNALTAGILKARYPASLPGYNGNNRWPVSAGATLAVCAGGPGEWTAADIDALRGTTPSHFATGAWLGIDTAGGDFTYGSILANGAGTLGLRKLGTNTLTLTQANTYSGGTVIHGGVLLASNAAALGASGTITVNSNAFLGVADGVTFTRAVSFQPGSGLAGKGTFSTGGAWTTPAGFVFRPGLPTGTLTVNAAGQAVQLSAGGVLDVAMGGGVSGKLLVNGSLDLSAAGNRLVLSGTPPGRRTVLAEAAAVTGQFAPGNVDMTGLKPKGTIEYTATEVVLNAYMSGAVIMMR